MGCGATTVRDENRDSPRLDRHSDEGLSVSQDVASGRRAEAAGDDSLPSKDDHQDNTSGTAQTQTDQGEITPLDLWSSLSRQEQIHFGGHFSRMLLRLVQCQITSATESNS